MKTMAFTSSSDDDHLPRRNARSFDLDDSAAKAAAWVWHLHTSKPGVSTEGRFISSQIRRRSSSNYDRKATRFRQEASIAPNTGASGTKTDTPMWDCGSNLYDTFELVSFGNRLDRSMMEDVVPITPRRAARPQEHHTKSPLHEPNGILRTHSLPRSLSRQRTKSHTEVASPSPSLSKSKLSKSDEKGTKVKSSTGIAQRKASTRWTRLINFMSVIKKVVVLHKQIDMVGCKRSINVIESSQRPLDSFIDKKDEKVRDNLSTSNLKKGDEFSVPSTKVSSNYGSTRGNYKLSIPSEDKSKYERKRGDSAKAYSSSVIDRSGLSTQALPGAKTRSNSESMRDAFLSEHKKSRPRRKCVEDEDDGIKGSNLEGANEKERVREANYEKVDYYKHLHHHHHHHHHHHYLHHNFTSESARLSPETMAQICADRSWLI